MSEYKRIYLQRCTDGETTWCEDEINEDDVEYVLGSEYDVLRAKLDEVLVDLQKGLKMSTQYVDNRSLGWYLKRLIARLEAQHD